MVKCDICGEKANKRLFTMDISSLESNCVAEICEKCEGELAEAIVGVANRRMREKFGKGALTIMSKGENNG